MRRLIVIAALALGASPSPSLAQTVLDGSDRAFDPATVRAISSSVQTLLNDPRSAQFRNLRPSPKDPRFICGEVNYKNAYGGYGSFIPFYYNKSSNSSVVPTPSGISKIEQIEYLLLVGSGCVSG